MQSRPATAMLPLLLPLCLACLLLLLTSLLQLPRTSTVRQGIPTPTIRNGSINKVFASASKYHPKQSTTKTKPIPWNEGCKYGKGGAERNKVASTSKNNTHTYITAQHAQLWLLQLKEFGTALRSIFKMLRNTVPNFPGDRF